MAKFVCARTRRRCVSILRCAVVIGTSVLLVVGEDAWAATAADSQPSSCAAAQPSRLIGEPHGPSFAQKAQPQLTPEQVANRLDKLFSIIAEADRQIPRDTFDPQAIIDKTGKNPTKIFEWVRDHTYFVPYRGLLRGDKGVLMDRLGNSLDRAMLLYSLLQVAGQSARMAHGTLSEVQAREVLKKVRPFPNLNGRTGPEASSLVRSTLAREYAEQSKLDLSGIRKQFEAICTQERQVEAQVGARVTTETAAIAAAVGRPPASVAAEERTQQARSIIDHWWVQFQNGSNWTNLDPTLPGSLPGQTLTTVQSTVAPKNYTDVGEKLVHTVDINVVIEVWKQGQLKEATVLKQQLVPAELIGEPIVLRQAPVRWPGDLNLFQEKDPVEALKKTALAQTEWLPVLTASSHNYSQYSFNDSGDLNNPASALANAEEQGAGSLGGAIGGMLSSHQIAPAPKPAVKSQPGQVSAEWIDYVIHTPGKQAETIRREIFDLIGPATRETLGAIASLQLTPTQRLSRVLSLLGTIDIFPVAAEVSPNFILHSSITGLVAIWRPVIAMMRETEAPDFKGVSTHLGAVEALLPLELYRLEFARSEWGNGQSSIYLDQPNILTYHRGPRCDLAGKLFFEDSIDIVANRLAPSPNSPKEPFQTRIRQGVLDTNAEAALAGFESGVQNAASAYFESNLHGEEWLVIRDVSTLASKGSKLPKDVRAHILADLRGGNIVIVPPPTARLKNCRAGCWWSINPQSGRTLGIGDRGWGQTAVEKILNSSSVVINIVNIGICSCTLLRNTTGSTSTRQFTVAAVSYGFCVSAALIGMQNTFSIMALGKGVSEIGVVTGALGMAKNVTGFVGNISPRQPLCLPDP